MITKPKTREILINYMYKQKKEGVVLMFNLEDYTQVNQL